MSYLHSSPVPAAGSAPELLATTAGPLARVMEVLQGIRSLQSNGLPYDETVNLTDAGFTSVEMVKVMLGVEAAFDLMIPQDQISPENFATPLAIAAMIGRLAPGA